MGIFGFGVDILGEGGFFLGLLFVGKFRIRENRELFLIEEVNIV